MDYVKKWLPQFNVWFLRANTFFHLYWQLTAFIEPKTSASIIWLIYAWCLRWISFVAPESNIHFESTRKLCKCLTKKRGKWPYRSAEISVYWINIAHTHSHCSSIKPVMADYYNIAPHFVHQITKRGDKGRASASFSFCACVFFHSMKCSKNLDLLTCLH